MNWQKTWKESKNLNAPAILSAYNARRGSIRTNVFKSRETLDYQPSETTEDQPSDLWSNDQTRDYEENGEDNDDDDEQSTILHLAIEPLLLPPAKAEPDQQCPNFEYCRYKSPKASNVERHYRICNTAKITDLTVDGLCECKGCGLQCVYNTIRKHLVNWKQSVLKNKKSQRHQTTAVETIEKYLNELKQQQKEMKKKQKKE